MKGEKSVPSLDEDSVTMAVEASRGALARSGIDPEDNSRLRGSESHPYVVKSSSAIVAEAIEPRPCSLQPTWSSHAKQARQDSRR